MTAAHCKTPAVHKKAQFVVNTHFSIIFFLVCFCLYLLLHIKCCNLCTINTCTAARTLEVWSVKTKL